MRTRAAVAVVLLSGLACLGVPSAAAGELVPTPAETTEATAPADELPPEPTPEASDVPTSVVTAPEPEEIAVPTEEPAEPSGEESPTTSDEATGEPTDAANPTPPAEGPEGTQAVKEGELGNDAESGAPIGTPAAAADEELPLSSQGFPKAVLDPRASIGDLNCEELTVPVTLDNSRSPGVYGFVVAAYADEGLENEDFYYQETFALAAGATRVVQVPVMAVDYVSIMVGDAALSFAVLDISCGEIGPRASIGDPDCNTFTVPINLDNSRSSSETTFWVTSVNVDSQESFAVPAGATQEVRIEVTEDSFEEVIVALARQADASDWLALEEVLVFCVPRQGWTTANIGEFDCNTQTFPITFDNSDVASTTRVWVLAESSGYQLDDWFSYDEAIEVAPRAIRVLRVRGPASDQFLDVNVSNLDEQQTPTENLNLAYAYLQITCPRTAARPTVGVKGAKLAATGGFNLALPLLGVALLTGGAGMLALTGRRRRY